MRQENLTPRNGETLMDWINRSRPETAPKVSGQLFFDPDNGFGWRVNNWFVTIEADEYGFTTVQWHTPNSSMSMCAGYSLTDSGEQKAVISTQCDRAEELSAWPIAV